MTMTSISSPLSISSSFLSLFCPLDQVRHIGHEIRTPLNVVGVGVDMLHKELAKQGALVPDEVREIVSEIQVNTPSDTPFHRPY